MSKGIQYLLVVSTTILVFATFITGKTIGVKDSDGDELKLKTPDDYLSAPEYGHEAALASALLAQDYQESLKEAEVEGELEDLEELEQELSTATEISNSKTHHRSKRTIGFLTRLGSCVMTFMSNPTCWSRLTRGQIQREEARQLQLLQQEQEKQMLEQQIYESYSNNLTNGTDATNGTSSGNSTTAVQKRQRAKMTTTTTTPRPKLFPMIGRLTSGMSRLFPRLFGFLNPNGNNGGEATSPSLISQFASSRSSSSSGTPQFRIHALQNA